MKKQGKPTTTTNPPAETPEQTQDETKALTAPKGIPIEDLIEYRRKGLTLEEIATLTGCTKQTVHGRLQSIDLDGLTRFDTHKDTILTHHQRRIVNALTDGDIQKMSGLQKLIGIKLTDEAIRTIRGQATEIIDHRVMVLDLGKAIEAMRAEQGQSGGDEQDTECSTIEIPVDNCPPPPK